jgi:hypothetical protein
LGGPVADIGTQSERLRAIQLTLNWLRAIDETSRLLYLPELISRLRVTGDLSLPGTMLEWDEIRQMQRAGIDFGAHTVTHPVLGKLGLPRLIEEIRGSKLALENRLQHPVRHFAYPFGKPADLSDDAKRVVRDAGFETAVTTISGFNLPGENLLELKRLHLEESDPAMFALKLDWSRMVASRPVPLSKAPLSSGAALV